jgi:hypothetical protein
VAKMVERAAGRQTVAAPGLTSCFVSRRKHGDRRDDGGRDYGGRWSYRHGRDDGNGRKYTGRRKRGDRRGDGGRRDHGGRRSLVAIG